MIIDLPDTTTGAVAKRLVKLRDEGGAVALGRVLTLIIFAQREDTAETVAAANNASREHPCRIIVLEPAPRADVSRLDAEIRIGGDAGASEVVVLRPSGQVAEHVDTLVIPLLLPDAPIVSWWPQDVPSDTAQDRIGAISQIRITDSTHAPDPRETLRRLSDQHRPGDTDLAWTRITLWRGLIAATLEQPPFEPVLRAVVEGETGHPSVDLMAAWLALKLGCPVERVHRDGVPAITRVTLHRTGGDIVLDRPDGRVATLAQPGQPQHRIPLHVRTLDECLAEELRRLDPDEIYTETLTRGLELLEGR